MHTFDIGPSIDGPDVHGENDDRPSLLVAGVEGSSLRATFDGLSVCPCGGPSASQVHGHRQWRYDQLQNVRVDAYGPIGVIRATVRDTGAELPLLLLEPDQITAARRSLEIIWNRMASLGSGAERLS
jgi:hypothetical protein